MKCSICRYEGRIKCCGCKRHICDVCVKLLPQFILQNMNEKGTLQECLDCTKEWKKLDVSLFDICDHIDEKLISTQKC